MFKFIKLIIFNKLILVFSILLISIIIPFKSWACSVCGVGDGDTYLWFIFILMPLPIIMIGLIVLWIYRKNKNFVQYHDN